MVSNPEVKADKTSMTFDTIKSILLVMGLFIIFQLINIALMDKLYDRNIGTIFIVVITIGAMAKVHLIYWRKSKRLIKQ